MKENLLEKQTNLVVLVRRKPTADVFPDSGASMWMTSSNTGFVAISVTGNSQEPPDTHFTVNTALYLNAHTNTNTHTLRLFIMI